MAEGNQLAIFNLTMEVIGEPNKQIQLVVGQALEPETAELRVWCADHMVRLPSLVFTDWSDLWVWLAIKWKGHTLA